MAALGRQSQIQWLDEKLCALYPPFAATLASERYLAIEQGLDRAATLGLASGDSLKFLCFEQTFGPAFVDQPEHEWARRILADGAVEPDQRMRNLKKAAIRRLFAEEDRLAAEAARARMVESDSE